MSFNQMNLISEGSSFEGTILFDQFTRFEGTINGSLKGTPGTEIVISNNGVVEGKIQADQITIDGFVRGEIIAKQKVIISGTGRVIGKIISPSIEIQFGGFFDGNCQMENLKPSLA